GVTRAFVSSTPDEGTVRLYDLAPERIVPVLQPYREKGDAGRWYQDPGVVPYLEERLARGGYRGIGEFHLQGSAARSVVVRQVGRAGRGRAAPRRLPAAPGRACPPLGRGAGRTARPRLAEPLPPPRRPVHGRHRYLDPFALGRPPRCPAGDARVARTAPGRR